ncbi:MAG: ATP-binding cassette domain-containing protein [Lachnospiraceae bacterium]|nr:ATP-binding cassette domain-containing protein [Lachnospiraceae bacterium]
MKIVFENVTKKYADTETVVLNNFNMTVEKGEFVLLTGRSGIGKSTVLRLLLREILPEKGEIKVGDDSLTDMKGSRIPYYRRKLGVVFQNSPLIETKNVFENICLAREIIGGRKKDSRKVVTSICSFLGIANLYKRYPSQLSGGQKQKVCLARALVNYPDLILADEPTGNLSYEESKEIMKLFELIHKQGITVLIATHDKESMGQISYREILLEEEADNERIKIESN